MSKITYAEAFPKNCFPFEPVNQSRGLIDKLMEAEFFHGQHCQMYTNVPYRSIFRTSDSDELSEATKAFLEEQTGDNRVIDYLFCKGSTVLLGVDFYTLKAGEDCVPDIDREELPILLFDKDNFDNSVKECRHIADRVKSVLSGWREYAESSQYRIDLLTKAYMVRKGYFTENDSMMQIYKSLDKIHMAIKTAVPEYNYTYKITDYGASSGLVYSYFLLNNEPCRSIKLLKSFDFGYRWKSGELSYRDIINELFAIKSHKSSFN